MGSFQDGLLEEILLGIIGTPAAATTYACNTGMQKLIKVFAHEAGADFAKAHLPSSMSVEDMNALNLC